MATGTHRRAPGAVAGEGDLKMDTLWTFETARCRVVFRADYECADLSDFTPEGRREIAEKLDDGDLVCFTAEIAVYVDGVERGAAYLGNCIYGNPAEFRDHVGMNGKGYGSYFSQMVREAIAEAREAVRGLLPLPVRVAA